jgi:hypothetical protein
MQDNTGNRTIEECHRLAQQAKVEFGEGNIPKACHFAKLAIACYEENGFDVPQEITDLISRHCD